MLCKFQVRILLCKSRGRILFCKSRGQYSYANPGDKSFSWSVTTDTWTKRARTITGVESAEGGQTQHNVYLADPLNDAIDYTSVPSAPPLPGKRSYFATNLVRIERSRRFPSHGVQFSGTEEALRLLILKHALPLHQESISEDPTATHPIAPICLLDPQRRMGPNKSDHPELGLLVLSPRKVCCRRLQAKH